MKPRTTKGESRAWSSEKEGEAGGDKGKQVRFGKLCKKQVNVLFVTLVLLVVEFVSVF